jgi:hypothetical protein
MVSFFCFCPGEDILRIASASDVRTHHEKKNGAIQTDVDGKEYPFQEGRPAWSLSSASAQGLRRMYRHDAPRLSE